MATVAEDPTNLRLRQPQKSSNDTSRSSPPPQPLRARRTASRGNDINPKPGFSNGHKDISPVSLGKDYFGPLEYGPLANVRGNLLHILIQVVTTISLFLFHDQVALLVVVHGLVIVQTLKTLAAMYCLYTKAPMTQLLDNFRYGVILITALQTSVAAFLESTWFLNVAPFALVFLVICVHLFGWASWFWIRLTSITISRLQHDGLRKDLVSQRKVKSISNIAPKYILLFAGSGGHTKELVKLALQYIPYDVLSFRRWVTTSGDHRSTDMIAEYEDTRRSFCLIRNRQVGGHEIIDVARARLVGQSWLTTPFTTLQACYDCYKTLMRDHSLFGDGQTTNFPQTILCTGPGSAAAFVLVSHILKMIGIIPLNRCRVVYMESFAKVTTLSLTGNIIYHLGLADIFIVQWQPLADIYKLPCEPMLSSRQPVGL